MSNTGEMRIALWANSDSNVGNLTGKNSAAITTYYLKKKNNQPAARARMPGSGKAWQSTSRKGKSTRKRQSMATQVAY